jgi:hypothetical protein
MPVYRKTAVLELELPSGAMETSLPLATEREFGVLLTIDGKTYPAQTFQSPINDEQWREFIRQLRDCNVNRDVKTGYRGATAIRALGRMLYQSLAQLSPALRAFLDEAGTARRLVIQTTRPELHLLPWAGMYDESGHLLAVGDLSVVQAWDDFEALPVATRGQLQLMKVVGQDTNQRTAAALEGLQRTPEIVQQDVTDAFEAGKPVDAVDVLHLEKHGNAVQGETGDVASVTLGATFAQAKIALLWSCYSGAANSWGESPHWRCIRMALGWCCHSWPSCTTKTPARLPRHFTRTCSGRRQAAILSRRWCGSAARRRRQNSRLRTGRR